MAGDQVNPMERSKLDELHELDWVDVPNVAYVMKYVFCDNGYHVIMSNLTALYGERLTDTDIETRFNGNNSFAEMKIQVILENLKSCLKKCLTESDLILKLEETKVTITLSFEAAHALCKYDIEMNIMPTDKLVKYVIGPTVFGALLSQRKVSELEKKILSVESSKSSISTKTVSTQNYVDPEWLTGGKVPPAILCESFLALQSHFKDLFTENFDAYLCSKKHTSENIATLHSLSPHKKMKLLESISFDDDGGCSMMKRVC